MPLQVLASEVIRRTANYQPSIWGDQFTAYTPDDEITHNQQKQQIEDLKVEVRKELMATASQPSQQLKYIDAVQRLGVGYHFEKEIEDSLQKIYDTYDHGCTNSTNNYNEDLYLVSLWFRLLRQQGYNVSSDIFKKFLNEKGSFRGSMTGDVSGLLCLYEAAHLRDHGEDVLDEALAFTIIHLQSFAAATQIPSNPLTVQVNRALERPHRKGLPRVEAKHYISAYQEDGSHSKSLLMLAKLDFNLLQALHKEELRDICIWWKELDLTTKLTFTRDRIVETYFWALGVYFEPQYSHARRMLAKVTTMLAITDDIYDNYGTLEELELYTQAIERWDIKSVETIPGNMLKLCYQTLLNIFHNEIEEGIAKGSGTTYRVHYAKEAMKKLVQGYFAETKWYKENYIPTVEEYMNIGLLTTANTLLTILSFVGMGDIATKEAFDWVLKDPKMMTSSAAISRLMDDMVSHKFEQERGHIASSVECYMKQHGVSEKHVYDVFQKQVANAWKDMNHQCITPLDHVPMSLLTRIINLARVIDFIYKDEDGFSHNGKTLKGGIVSLLVDPVPI